MNYSDLKVTLQEVPGEISICFTINGCSLRCKGCHSSYLWKKNGGKELTLEKFQTVLNQYQYLASCVLFMGGEWEENELVTFLKKANDLNYNTCLYTGETEISKKIEAQLNWLKTGPWVEELGGLSSKHTNQQFKEVKTDTLLNHLFQKN